MEPQGPAYFLPNNPDQFIWKAQGDDYYHLYLYTISKGTSKQLTHGDFVITDFDGFSPKGKYIYYRSTEVSPLERHCYMMELKSGKVTQLTRYIQGMSSPSAIVAKTRQEAALFDSKDRLLFCFSTKNDLQSPLITEAGDLFYEKWIKAHGPLSLGSFF